MYVDDENSEIDTHTENFVEHGNALHFVPIGTVLQMRQWNERTLSAGWQAGDARFEILHSTSMGLQAENVVKPVNELIVVAIDIAMY